MKLLLIAGAIAFGGASAFVTDYKQERVFRIEHEVRSTVEVKSVEFERDGEVQPTPDMAMPTSESTFHVVQTDTVRASADGKPKEIRRQFTTVAGKLVSNSSGEERTEDIESPFEDLTIDLTLEDDAVHLAAVEGKLPEHDGAQEGHRLELCLDALLPAEPVEVDASWDLDNESVRRALAFDLHKSLFPRTEETPPAEGGEGRGRRRGMGMSRLGGRGLLAQSEWTGKAKLASLDEEVDGVKCAKIELTLHSEGELPDQGPGPGGGGRRGGAPLWTDGATSAAPVTWIENTYEIELEGTLLFALESRRPLSLELEGRLELETSRESTRNEQTTRFRSRSEGEMVVRVTVREGAEDK